MKKSAENALIYDEMSENIISATTRLVKENGAQGVTVRTILKELDISNRVFYNRFRNLDEVLKTVYVNLIAQLKSNISLEIPENTDFWDYTMELAIKVLTDTYDILRQFYNYSFEHTVLSEQNRLWWTEHIKKLFLYAQKNNLVRNDLDFDALSYFVWCVCRGLNSDAVTRNYSRSEAADYLKAGFTCFIDGIKKQ